MKKKKNVLAIVGSAATNSANLKIVETIASLSKDELEITIYNDLKKLPHFDPEQTINNTPKLIIEFRNSIEQADGIIICTPEYIFSIPSGLKNAIEWCISSTVFSNKACALITASANGQKGHEALQLIMKTAMARFTNETTLLIEGVKGKFNEQAILIDPDTVSKLLSFIACFTKLVNEK
jgi:chromate reductase, NAD(P)H dehydrogenase (quinone)